MYPRRLSADALQGAGEGAVVAALDGEGGTAADFREIGVRREEGRDLLLVLLWLVRAGGVDEETVGGDMRGGGGEDLRLETHELPQMVRVPAPAGVRTAAQHTRVRTGRIHEHAVEDAFGGGLRHRDPIEPEACQIVLETPQPLRIHFLRDEPSRAAEAPGDLRGLAARGGTEIEDAEAGFHVQQIDGKRSVGDIALLVKDKFGKEAEPLYDRLVKYMQILHNNGFIYYEGKDKIRK